jgi:hypothetical protein
MSRRTILSAAACTAAIAGIVTGSAGAASHKPSHARASHAPTITQLRLTASNAQLAACMPHASVKVTDISTTDQLGFDVLNVRARALAPDRSYTIFLLQQAGAPFGAAQYLGDITTDGHGNAKNQFRAIIDEAFSSTLAANGQRQRVELNQVGMWFADPADDDFCAAAPGIHGVTPFDGDNEAGVQAFNSAHTQPLPAP